MFASIILLDRDGGLIEEIVCRYPLAQIILVAEKQKKVLEHLAKFSNNIQTFIDYDDLLAIQDTQNIDYKTIEKMKFIQNDVEIMLHRVMLNNPLSKDIYHQHLSFFIKIFQNQKIDLVLCSEYNLATPNHLIPFGLGKLLGIPTYAIEHLPSCPAISLNNFNHFERISFNKECEELTPQSIVFYKHKSLQNSKKTIREKFEHIFGALSFEFIKCIMRRSFKCYYLGIEYSFFDKLKSLFALKKIKKTYKKLSCPPDYENKYIYYSIHLEPEATVIGKTILESQLTMIKMLASALPEDWKLYVKEHPHQFMLNTKFTHYFLHNIIFFKNAYFYQEINKLKNVSLIALNASTKELIKHSQAVATINGTVTLEAMFEKKHAILFSGKAGLYGILGNVLHISSYQDVKNAIKTIQTSKNSISPDNEFKKLKRYITNTEDQNYYNNLFSAIEEHAKTIEPTGETL